MMQVVTITRAHAVAITGIRLPFGMRWYLVIGAEWYPTYGDWSHTWAGENGLNAIVGKQKAVIAKAVAA